MKLWQSVAESVNREAKKYKTLFIPEDSEINTSQLCVVNDSLKIGSPGSTKVFIRDAKPLEGYSYMLFRLEKRTAQDRESLTSIK